MSQEMVATPDHLVVVHKRRESDTVVSVALADPSGAPLPAWEPGAHLELELEPHLIRHYSLCGSRADDRQWLIGVLLEPSGRGGSRFVHERLDHGHMIRLRRIRNKFPLRPASNHLFIAGGIGITPILPMVRLCAEAGTPYTLYYTGRNERSMAFLDDLPPGGDNRIVFSDVQGLLDVDAALREAPVGSEVYCCGPAPLIEAVEKSAGRHALPFHFERFAADVETGAELGGEPDAAFEVELAQSGGVYQVPPGTSIMEALEAGGITVDFSCREGSCGTCETKVLAGQPDHRDSVLDDEERAAGETMMLCVSRSLSQRLTLDL